MASSCTFADSSYSTYLKKRYGVNSCKKYENSNIIMNELKSEILKEYVSDIELDPEHKYFFNYSYGYTELSTTGNNILTEQDYLNSFENININGLKIDAEPILKNSNIRIDSFRNGAKYKVLFLILNDYQPGFSLWSDVTDSIQKNEVIDLSLSSGGNVWFKSEYQGKTIYFTRYQTRFSGNILFHRSPFI